MSLTIPRSREVTPCSGGDWTSAGVVSDGSYEVPRGLIFGTLFRIVGRPIFGRYARQVIANLEQLERQRSPATS